MNRLLGGVDRSLQTCRLVAGRVRAVGLAMRGARIGSKTELGPGSRVDRPWCVELGSRVVVESDVFIKVVTDDARVILSDHVFVGRGCELDISGRLTIGAHSLLAPGCFITDHNHGTGRGMRIDEQPGEARPVVIGCDVWLGFGVCVLPGVSIGDGAIVAAGAVVTRDIPAYAVAAGVPAKVMRFRNE